SAGLVQRVVVRVGEVDDDYLAVYDTPSASSLFAEYRWLMRSLSGCGGKSSQTGCTIGAVKLGDAPCARAPLASRRSLPGTVVVLMVGAAAIGLRGLSGLDLFCDEAQSAEIASSLWTHGDLNLFRYSHFLPDRFFRNGPIVYFPPLSYAVAA